MTWAEFIDDFPAFLDVDDDVVYYRIQDALMRKLDVEVPQQVVDNMAIVKEKLFVLDAEKDVLMKQFREMAIKGATDV